MSAARTIETIETMESSLRVANNQLPFHDHERMPWKLMGGVEITGACAPAYLFRLPGETGVSDR